MNKIYTSLGQGRIVYTLSDGTYVVEFDHGGGHIFLPEELFPGKIRDVIHESESQGGSFRRGDASP